MRLGALRRPRRARSIALLALPALLLRLLVPAGFMPGIGEDESLTMQVCHGAGSGGLQMQQPAPDKAEEQNGADHSSPCLYAASSVAAPPPVIPTDTSGALIDRDPVAAARPAAPSLRSLHRAQAPRAPPLQS
jgi:hypothetical protein